MTSMPITVPSNSSPLAKCNSSQFWQQLQQQITIQFILLSPPLMNNLPPTIYEDSQICLPCWGVPRPRTLTTLEIVMPDSARDTNRDKKISLKRYSQNGLDGSYCKVPARNSHKVQAVSKRTRVQSTLPTQEQINQPHMQEALRFGQLSQRPMGFGKAKPELTYFAQPMPVKNKSALLPTSNMMRQTTKIQRILPTRKDQLEKTKKIGPVTILNLEKFKESVCSYTEECDLPPRMEESQILLDYFHPSEARLIGMKDYLHQSTPQMTRNFSKKF